MREKLEHQDETEASKELQDLLDQQIARPFLWEKAVRR